MFRELTRKQLQLSQEECAEVLKNEKRGVLSVIGDEGYPYGMPMNHFYNEADGCVYFHCGKFGHRLDALRKCNKVSFCVYDKGTQVDDGWALSVKSVIVFGKMELIDDIDKVIDITTKLCYKFTDDEKYIKQEIDAYAEGTLLLRLVPEHICGKRVKES